MRGAGGPEARGAALAALALLGALLHPLPARAQADSTAAPVVAATRPDSAAERPSERPSAGGALRRSLAVPGWGQVHIGKPGRAAVAAALVGGLATGVVFANGRYVRLRHAYLYVSREDADPTVPDSANAYGRYFEAWRDAGALPASTVRSRRDGARRTRDLTVLATALAYALQALDAYVGAHLLDFDVSEDLSLRAGPAAGGVGAALRVRL